MREKLKSGLRRAFWLFMALLFIATGLGVGIYYFWLSTRPADQSKNSNQNQSANQLKGKPLSGFAPVAQVANLQVVDQKVGSGDSSVQPNSTVTVLYTGAVASTGIVFESSADTGQATTFQLNQVIRGWQEGLLGMKVGGQRRLLIPANLAYGANPPAGSTIPPNAGLVFDIILLSIK